MRCLSGVRAFGTVVGKFNASGTAQHFSALDPTHCLQGGAGARQNRQLLGRERTVCFRIDEHAKRNFSQRHIPCCASLRPKSEKRKGVTYGWNCPNAFHSVACQHGLRRCLQNQNIAAHSLRHCSGPVCYSCARGSIHDLIA